MRPEDVRLVREDLGLTRHEFGLLLGCNEHTAWRWEVVGAEGATAALLRALDASGVVPSPDDHTQFCVLLSQGKADAVLHWLLGIEEELPDTA